MRNTLSEDEMDVFRDYLEISNSYFEYGSSLTTIIASETKNLKKIFTVTSEEEIYNELVGSLSSSNVQILYKNINGGKLGIPTNGNFKNIWPEYPSAILDHSEPGMTWDLVMLNGRFRVAAAAAAYSKISEDGYLMVHDFDRNSYSPINTLYTKIKIVKTLAIFKKKSLALDLFNKYKYVYE